MQKSKYIKLYAGSLIIFLLYSIQAKASTIKDTSDANTDLTILRTLFSLHPWLKVDVEYSSKTDNSGFQTNWKYYHFKNGQYAIKSGAERYVKNYAYSFRVDTIEKIISFPPEVDAFSVLMVINPASSGIRNFVERMYVVDSGSLKKLVVDFKPSSVMEKYIAVYDPSSFLPLEIRYSYKYINSSGQRDDHEFICRFHNYQTTAFDELVFSSDPYLQRINGELALTAAYSDYKLIPNR